MALTDGSPLVCALVRINTMSKSARTAILKGFIPCRLRTLLFLALQTHGHHPPGQILHALLVRQLRFSPRIQLPYLCSQRIFPLHLVRVAHAGSGCSVVPFGKKRIVEELAGAMGGIRRTHGGTKRRILGYSVGVIEIERRRVSIGIVTRKSLGGWLSRSQSPMAPMAHP